MIAGHLPELIIVLVLALVVFGPKRLPEVGSSMGKGIRDFKKHLNGTDEDITDHRDTVMADPVPVTVETHTHHVG